MSPNYLWDDNEIWDDFSILHLLLSNWCCFLDNLVNYKAQKRPTVVTDALERWSLWRQQGVEGENRL